MVPVATNAQPLILVSKGVYGALRQGIVDSQLAERRKMRACMHLALVTRAKAYA